MLGFYMFYQANSVSQKKTFAKSSAFTRIFLKALSGLLLFLAVPGFTQDFDDREEIDLSVGVRQTDVVIWQVPSVRWTEQGNIEAIYYLSTRKGFSIYESKLKFKHPEGFEYSEAQYPEPQKLQDPVTEEMVNVYQTGEFIAQYNYIGELPAPTKITLPVKFIACTSEVCLMPYTQKFEKEILGTPPTAEKIAALAVQNSQEIDEKLKAEDQKVAGTSGENKLASDISENKMAKSIGGDSSFWLQLLIVLLAGLATNLTPCVLPMIPITMRVLSGQSKSPFLASSLYAGGIMLTYSALGIFAASTGSLFGSMLANPWVNVAFATMMFLFGISMLGFGNLSKLQMLGNKLGTAKNPSAANAFWMGTGAGLVAAPCTGPVLASLLGWITASGDFFSGSILMVGYSFGFSVPYIFLGGASGKLSGFKVAPFWQVAIKMVFGAVMIGLGFYYLRVPLYKVLPALEGRWTLFSTVGLVVGLGLLGWILANAKLQNKKNLQLATALLLGFGGFSLSQANYVAKKKKAGIVWIKSPEAAFAKAAETGKPILVDGWAEWCSSCKKMDVTTFADQGVAEVLKNKWVLLKIDLTESNDSNAALMQRFGIQTLPTLVMVPADGNLDKKERILGYTAKGALIDRLEGFTR